MTIQSTAISGLLTAQRGLTVTSHNISNVNTPGYSRQEIELNAREADFRGNGFVGNGVEITNIIRVHDSFITGQLRTSISAEMEASSFLNLASRVDNILANEETGLTLSLQNFFNAIQDVNDLPSSIAARQSMLSEADSLASRFQFLHSRLSDMSSEIRLQLSNGAREVNTLVDGIARLNVRITKAMGDATGQSPNDLLDMRDKLIEDLSELVGVNVVDQADGATNIFIGNGQPLVLGGSPSVINTSETYPGHYQILVTSNFGTSDITQFVQGGKMGGVLNFQNQMLEPAINSLGRLAIGLAETFNTQHELGQNLDGEIDRAFFASSTPDVIPLGTAPNNVNATITDPTALTDSNYSLVYNGANIYTLTRQSDGQATTINTGGAGVFVTAPVDGVSLTINAGAAVNDEFVIRPTVNGAADIRTLVSDPRKIAAGAILRSGEATDAVGVPQNTGTALISEVDVSSVTGLPLATPVTLTFDAALNQFNVSAPPGGTLAYNPAIESGGKQFTLAALGNATFSISGDPNDGDQFVIENNSNAAGDNQNGLKLSALQSSNLLVSGTSTYQDSYAQVVAEIGSNTRQAQISGEALGALKSQALSAREAVSGVNLEEEAANMLKYQQAFQAAAQMIGTADRIFQTLLQAME